MPGNCCQAASPAKALESNQAPRRGQHGLLTPLQALRPNSRELKSALISCLSAIYHTRDDHYLAPRGHGNRQPDSWFWFTYQRHVRPASGCLHALSRYQAPTPIIVAAEMATMVMVLLTAGARTISAATWNSAIVFERGYSSPGTGRSRKRHISSQPKPRSKSSTSTRSVGTSASTVSILSSKYQTCWLRAQGGGGISRTYYST